MPYLTYYRQKRADGGIRSGVELGVDLGGGEVGSETILDHFEPGDGDRDPTLLWFVDVRCAGPGVPNEAEAARQWLLSTSHTIEGGLTRFADRLRRVGSDLDDYPLQSADFPDEGGDVERRIVCSAIRRLDARGLAVILDDIRVHWGGRIREMIAQIAAYAPQD